MLRLGVIGRRGQAGLWAKAAGKAPGWRLGASYYPKMVSWTEFLEGSDAVVIASPTSTHLDYLRRLSRKFKGPVLVEKPVVASLEECRRLIRGLPPSFVRRIYVAHNWRFYPWVAKMREILRRNRRDPVLAAEFHLTHDFGFKPDYSSSWRSKKRSHPVGPAETQGIHWIDLVHHLFGPLEWLGGGVRQAGRAGSAPDTASIFLKTRSGTHCAIHTSYVAPVAYYARIVTTRAILTYRDGRLEIQKQPPPKTGALSRPAARQVLLEVSLDELMLQPLVSQLKELRSLLKRGAPLRLVRVHEGMANVAALEGFTLSLRLKKPFAMSRFPLYAKWMGNLHGT